MNIRDASIDDAAAIARINIESGRTAYQGILPDRVLDGLSHHEELTLRVATSIGKSAAQGRIMLVLDDPAHGVIGFLNGGAELTGDPVYTAEVFQLYLSPDHQRRGLGRLLLSIAARRLAQNGHRALLIWVFTANAAGRRFYEAVGGEAVREREIDFFGAPMAETGYGWRDIGRLVGASENESNTIKTE